jgi:hypothetical protein
MFVGIHWKAVYLWYELMLTKCFYSQKQVGKGSILCRWYCLLVSVGNSETVNVHCKGNLMLVFLFWELHGLSPNFHNHVSVSDLYIPRIGPHFPLQQNRQTNPGNTYINSSQIYECRNWETEDYNSVLEIAGSFQGIHK